MSSKTTHIRVDKELVKVWNEAFPGVDKAQVIRMTWNTSLLNMESKLKKKDVKNKVGRYLYGDNWKNE